MSKHMYYMNAIKKLFLARTKETDLLLESKKNRNGKEKSKNEMKITKYLKEEHYPVKYDETILEELRMHRLIRLSVIDNVLLFMHNNIFCCKFCPWKKSVKLRKLYS